MFHVLPKELVVSGRRGGFTFLRLPTQPMQKQSGITSTTGRTGMNTTQQYWRSTTNMNSGLACQ